MYKKFEAFCEKCDINEEVRDNFYNYMKINADENPWIYVKFIEFLLHRSNSNGASKN